jgi:hypothetical protein
MFAAIYPELAEETGNDKEKVLLHFGFEDTVLNHLLLLN